MSADFPGFSSPAAAADAPLEMLAACHQRVLSQCQTLQRLLPHLGAHGADAAARQAAQAVLRYFDLAARNHHDDEERDLFPALLESVAGSDAHCIRALIEQLSAQHRALEARWRRLRVTLLTIAGGQFDGPGDAALVDDFVRAYQSHIAQEEADLLPLAARLLDQGALTRIGLAMGARRGL